MSESDNGKYWVYNKSERYFNHTFFGGNTWNHLLYCV